MSHKRTQIRAALKALLETISGQQGYVVDDMSDIGDASAAPWVVVATGGEQVQPQSLGMASRGRVMLRAVAVTVDLYSRGKSQAIDANEALSAQVEAAIFTDRRLGGLLLSPLTLSAIAVSPPDQGGSLAMQQLRMVWDTKYSTAEGNPSASS